MNKKLFNISGFYDSKLRIYFRFFVLILLLLKQSFNRFDSKLKTIFFFDKETNLNCLLLLFLKEQIITKKNYLAQKLKTHEIFGSQIKVEQIVHTISV